MLIFTLGSCVCLANHRVRLHFLVQSSTMSSTDATGKKRKLTDEQDDSLDAKITMKELMTLYKKARKEAEKYKLMYGTASAERERFKRDLNTATTQGIKWQQQACKAKGQNELLQKQLADLKKELDEVSTKLHFFQFMQMLDEQQENDADDAGDEGGSDGESDAEVVVEDEVNDDDVNDGNETDS